MATTDQQLISHESDVIGGHPDMDYAEHERTYRMFLGLAKWGALAIVIILMILGWMWL